MSVGSQQYAGLANDHCDVEGGSGPGLGGTEAPVWIAGVKYDVLERYRSPRTGYLGTIYQHAGTGEIVVAHRDIAFDPALLQDDGVVDVGRLLACSKLQLPEAMALTWGALDLAEKYSESRGVPAPRVTTTGHSLGGHLAQVTAYRFDLAGEAFNPYGAAGQDHGVPEGGHRFINHVIATDPVSAASRHYGQLRIYAREHDILALWLAGYGRFEAMPEQMLGMTKAARSRLAAHHMHNFLGVDGEGKPTASVLQDAPALQRAQQNRQAIADYREQSHRVRDDAQTGHEAVRCAPGRPHPSDAEVFSPTTKPLPPVPGRQRLPHGPAERISVVERRYPCGATAAPRDGALACQEPPAEPARHPHPASNGTAMSR